MTSPEDLNEGYPSRHECWLTLRDGRRVFLRPVLPTDESLLVDLFDRISPRTRYLRFLRHLDALPEDMLCHFTHVDYDDKFALVAVIEENGKDAVVGVARYAVDPPGNAADLGITVRDDWQNLGLGSSLLARIIDVGRAHAVSRFKSMLNPQNNVIRRMLSELCHEVKYYLRDGFLEVEIVVQKNKRRHRDG